MGAAAAIACAAVDAIPQLGFIHEDSGQSLVLDIADLFRDSVTIPVAFVAAKQAERGLESVERLVRRQTGRTLAERSVIPQMIDRLKQLFEAGEQTAEPVPPPRRRAARGGEDQRNAESDGEGNGDGHTRSDVAGPGDNAG